MPLPPKLQTEIDELRNEFRIDVFDEPTHVGIIIRKFPIGPGYNQDEADVLVRVPLTYPDAGPDMFWTVPGLMLANGAIPQNADSLEICGGDQWRRFSWHHNSWNATKDNFQSYLEFVRRRLTQAK